MAGIAEAELAARCSVRLCQTEHLEPRHEADCNDRARLRIGHELARLAFQLQPIAQATPFQAIGVLNENRQDAGAGAAQAGRSQDSETTTDRERDFIFLACTRSHDE